MQYLKQAPHNTIQSDAETRRRVESLLAHLEQEGESAAQKLSQELDQWDGPYFVSAERIAAAEAQVSPQQKSDIHYAYERVRLFAEAQRESVQDFERELAPGLWAAQRLVPLNCAGCYVPGGRYAHVASAIMSITTAKVAGVKKIVACSPPSAAAAEYGGLQPAMLYTMHLCGADHILALGGVQGVAALAFGLFTGQPADIVVGPGNRFVAEAKRQLYGRVGIDLFAGPTESLVIADASADPELVAVDMVSQMEHGADSPVWLISTDRALAEKVMNRIPSLIAELPETAQEAAAAAWRDHAEIVLCDDADEAVAQSDRYAPEHLQLMVQNPEAYVTALRNYGALFVGEESTVTYGDKCAGPNHILPTRGAARYTGGLSVHKFLKVLTTQRMTPQASAEMGAVAARISRTEGMEGHARSGDIRVEKYRRCE